MSRINAGETVTNTIKELNQKVSAVIKIPSLKSEAETAAEKLHGAERKIMQKTLYEAEQARRERAQRKQENV